MNPSRKASGGTGHSPYPGKEGRGGGGKGKGGLRRRNGVWAKREGGQIGEGGDPINVTIQ